MNIKSVKFDYDKYIVIDLTAKIYSILFMTTTDEIIVYESKDLQACENVYNGFLKSIGYFK